MSLRSHVVFLLLAVGSAVAADADTQAPLSCGIQLRVLPGSRVFIEGRSSINTFRYDYQGLPANPRGVDLGSPTAVVSRLMSSPMGLGIEWFDSGNRRMNQDFRDLLEAASHPEIIIAVEDLQARDAAGAPIPLWAETISQILVQARFTIAGVERTHSFPIEVIRDGQGIRLHGNVQIDIGDYGLEPPTALLGLIKVQSRITISISLRLRLV